MTTASSASSDRESRGPELLAPAGDGASLDAALTAGADAVYFGLDEGFNARARARNFTLDGLAETVSRVHLAGARVHLALNTLVFEDELAAVAALLARVAASGVDAIIVQDPAVARLAAAICPELELHASTQWTISDAAAARFAEELGVRRVVVPRELSVAEIEAFARGTPLELEVFVHGALCVSWSGQCLTSEAWTGRSANRGQCAQSCRLPYRLEVDGEPRELGGRGDLRYLLSPKDLAGATAVPDLMRLGIAGLKIEGRQKGPAYVASAVRGYRRLIDGVADGGEGAALEGFAEDRAAMTLAYSRGFGDGFLGGSDHQRLVDGRFPKHRGAYLGEVAGVRGDEVEVAAASAVAVEPRAGQGVVFDAGDPEDKSEPGGPVFSVERRGERWLLRFGRPGPDLARVAKGQRVWITSDPEVARLPQRLAAEAATAPGRIALRIEVAGRAGEPLRCRASCALGGHAVEHAVDGSTPLEAARGGGLDEAILSEKLGALGGTPFHLAALDASGLEPGLHAPVSELKALRRALVEELGARIARGRVRTVAAGDAIARVRERLGDGARDAAAPPVDSPTIVPLCRDDAQLDAALEAGLREVELDWMELVGLRRAAERARGAGAKVVIATLRVAKPTEERFLDAALDLAGADGGLLVRHWSAVVRSCALAPSGRPELHGDFSLNVANSLTALELLSRGFRTLTPGYDLDGARLRALLAAPGIDAARFTLPLWHRVPAFHTEHCVYAHLLSDGADWRTCGRPCEAHRVSLRDDAGRRHPVIVDAGCRNTVFDGKAQSAVALVDALLARGVRRFRVELLRESATRTRAILDAARRRVVERAIDDREFLAATGARARVGLATGARARAGLEDRS